MGSTSCVMKPTVHNLAFKALPDLAPGFPQPHHLPLSLCSSCTGLLGAPWTHGALPLDLMALARAVPAGWTGLFYTIAWPAPSHPSQTNIASSEKPSLTTLTHFSAESLLFCFIFSIASLTI